MQQRTAARLNCPLSEIGFGAWAIGGSWGDVSEEDAKATLSAALDSGVTFIDTADVYGDGRSERIIRDVLKARGGAKPFVATKAGRRLSPHVADGYTAKNLEAFIDRSLSNLGVDCLDLAQLHCPPTEVYYRPDVFGALDDLKAKGKIAAYGVSVEKVEEALKAIEYEGVASVQIIYNMFRLRPAQLFFREAEKKGVTVIARVPLASGLLTGKMTRDSVFAADDHRQFNRHGEAFDVGETFSGVPYDVALEAVEEIRALCPTGLTMAEFALAFILADKAVTSVIPGARRPDQAVANSRGAGHALEPATLSKIAAIYREKIAPHVHHRW